jgi:polar amino acid transport system substrate-binding protein
MVYIISFCVVVISLAIFATWYFKLFSKIKNLESITAKLTVFQKSAEAHKDGIIILSDAGEIVFFNTAFQRLLKLKPAFNKDDLVHAKVFKLKSSEQINIETLVSKFLYRKNEESEFSIGADLIIDNNETPIRIFLSSFPVNNKGKTVNYMIIDIGDLTHDLVASQRKQKNMVSNLPNQYKMIEDMGILIARMQDQNRTFALILLSLDNSSTLIATFGHLKAETLLNRLSEGLKQSAKEMNCTLYHVQSNDFMMIASDVHMADEIIKIVKAVEKNTNSILDFTNTRMRLTFSTGVSFFPKCGSSTDILIDNTYKAMTEAKKKGDGFLVFARDLHSTKSAKHELEVFNEMHDAIANNEFVLFYQPIVDIQKDQITGAEALIRWRHPVRGLIPPIEFIPIAEKTGFIIELGKFIIEEAIRQQKRWETFNFNPIQVSINLSLREIETADIVTYIADMLKKYQINPSLAKFEITENLAMSNAEKAKSEFMSLKRLGVELSLDDFGTGYSSFAYLKDFSLDTLKIDRIFISDLVRNKDHQQIVKAMIMLGHNLDLTVTAEGVEDKKTYDLLKEYGCDFVQGYLIAKPLPVFEFQELIRNEKSFVTGR